MPSPLAVIGRRRQGNDTGKHTIFLFMFFIFVKENLFYADVFSFPAYIDNHDS